jgi:peptidoglycan/LPS O-acetylase OafA/YrhL
MGTRSIQTRKMHAKQHRLFLLDILRGLAAFSVVVWHYQNFFYISPGVHSSDFSPVNQPFYTFLYPFYEKGYFAAFLFFVLSGYIFFRLYSEKVYKKTISPYQFFILRFSRLYPLHLATLLIVTVLQVVSINKLGNNFIYGSNDWKHFLLNLPLASWWGFQEDLSFNAPVWTVSVGILLYAIFFLYTRFDKLSLIKTILIMFSIYLISKPFPHVVWVPLYCFFAGGGAFLVGRSIEMKFRSKASKLAVATSILGASLLFYFVTQGRYLVLLGAIFPSTIVLLSTIQSIWAPAGKHFRLMGDLSYSTYLIHIPLQIFILLLSSLLGIQVNYYSPLFFCLFFLVLILLSYATHVFFEAPLQKLIRTKLLA